MRGVRGPPRAAELPVVSGGCSHAMVGAQLWLGQSSATRKAEYGHGVDSPQLAVTDNGRWCSFTRRGGSIPKIEDRRHLRNGEMKRSRVSGLERNHYQFVKVGFIGGDDDGHFATKLARWKNVGGKYK